MEKLFAMLNGGIVTTDELIADFEAAAVCVTPGGCGSPMHELAGELAGKLKDYREWVGTDEDPKDVDLQEMVERKAELMDQMRMFAAAVEVISMFQSTPVPGPIN